MDIKGWGKEVSMNYGLMIGEKEKLESIFRNWNSRSSTRKIKTHFLKPGQSHGGRRAAAFYLLLISSSQISSAVILQEE